MSFPIDVVLPSNARYINFVDPKLIYNPHWDITWSFDIAIVGNNHGFCTFLTNTPIMSSVWPGHYLSYAASNLDYLLTETSELFLTENSEHIILEDTLLSGGFLVAGFDTTGLFALSTTIRDGVGLSNIKPNSLIIRGVDGMLTYQEQLSNLDTSFFLTSSVKNYQTLRFRYANAGRKFSIDVKQNNENYRNILTLNTSIDISLLSSVYVGFGYTSPVSGLSSSVSTLYLKNFHTQGNINFPNYETSSFIPISAATLVGYTVLSGITANPI